MRVPPADAELPMPPERAPKEGTLAGFIRFKNPPRAGLFTISLSAGGWLDVVQDGHVLKPKAFSGATDCDGIRKTMKHELSVRPLTLQVSGTREEQISIATLPSARGTLRDATACYVPACGVPAAVSRRDVRNGASACRIP